jgi:hypothetical protein
VWAEGFIFPEGVLRCHEDLFQKNFYNFNSMVSYFKQSLCSTRMSRRSILETISSDNPEIKKLLILVEGMPLFSAPEFVPNGLNRLLPVSQTYVRLAPVVNRMLFEDFVEKGLAFIIPKSLVTAYVPEFHVSRLSWTVKHGKKKGRPILDCSAGNPSVNSDFTKLSCDQFWGEIHHPTISDFVIMIMEFWEGVSSLDSSLSWWDDLVLWKIDLKGAYTLLSFEDAAIPYMAAELDSDSIIFFLCGVFGWTGTPASFQVVSRALKIEINKFIHGCINIYVDDLLGVSLRRHLESDIATAKSICCRLFNSECIEDSKTVSGRVLTVIGYTINLDSLMVSVAQKNYLRVIYGLSTITFERKVPIKTLQ